MTPFALVYTLKHAREQSDLKQIINWRIYRALTTTTEFDGLLLHRQQTAMVKEEISTNRTRKVAPPILNKGQIENSNSLVYTWVAIGRSPLNWSEVYVLHDIHNSAYEHMLCVNVQAFHYTPMLTPTPQTQCYTHTHIQCHPPTHTDIHPPTPTHSSKNTQLNPPTPHTYTHPINTALSSEIGDWYTAGLGWVLLTGPHRMSVGQLNW